MRTASILLASAALFAAWPTVGRHGAIPFALGFVALSVLVALAASGGVNALAAAAGALGAFAAGLVSPGATIVGGALLFAGAYAERTMRVRGEGSAAGVSARRALLAKWGPRAAHLVLAMVAGGIAGGIVESFGRASIALRLVAIGVASVLATLPRVIEADDLTAHALEGVAREVDEPARATLFSGADLRRHADDALLDRTTSKTVRGTWKALVRLAEARLRVQRARVVRVAPPKSGDREAPSPSEAVLAMLDTRLAEHVTALARAYAAVDTARAAELGLDDVALRTVESAGEALDHVSRAMIDVGP
jgi:hypothetical protein